MEDEIRWPGSGSGTADSSVAGGEHAIEAACSRAYAGQDDVAGCALKKKVKPSRRGPMVEALVGSYGVAERRACRVLRVPRATYFAPPQADQRPESVAHERNCVRSDPIHMMELIAKGLSPNALAIGANTAGEVDAGIQGEEVARDHETTLRTWYRLPTHSILVDMEQSTLHRDHDGCGAVRSVELESNSFQVALHSIFGDAEVLTNLLVAPALRHFP